MAELRQLELRFTKITDAGLTHLEGMTHLEKLNLENTNVTDVGLDHLKGLTSLRVIQIYGTRVTDGGVKKLQQSLPNCKIYQEDRGPFWISEANSNAPATIFGAPARTDIAHPEAFGFREP